MKTNHIQHVNLTAANAERIARALIAGAADTRETKRDGTARFQPGEWAVSIPICDATGAVLLRLDVCPDANEAEPQQVAA